MRQNEEAQIHILEMLTLFWLFFMSATFLIRIQVPDAPSVAHDAALEIAGDDAFRYGIGLEAEISGENRLSELLENGELNEACQLLQDYIVAGKEANCWLAQNSGTSAPYGNTGAPAGETVTVHHLLSIDEHSWTVTLDVWSRGGGA
ncbi:MAG: hypothetical protein HN458_00550 [Euryarchaeota archaeon]|jgi:hypothetical protein|nr:hypothetical protein [Euryarchaeota archaeon]